MTNREAALMIERIRDGEPWEQIDWSDSALAAMELAINALCSPRLTRCEDCFYCSTEKHSSGKCMWCNSPDVGGHRTNKNMYCAWAKEK